MREEILGKEMRVRRYRSVEKKRARDEEGQEEWEDEG